MRRCSSNDGRKRAVGALTEMCEGSGVRAEIRLLTFQKLPNLAYYLEQKSVPGGTGRNFSSYGNNIAPLFG